METNRIHILLPTDFSDNAWSAAVYALKLYAEQECTFYFFHSTKMKVSTMSNLSNKLLKVMSDEARKELLELKETAEVSNTNPNHDFEIILSSDDLVDTIAHTVRKHQINLVVMGTKGATGTKKFFFGSNTVHIAKKMRLCPILIVPEEFDFETPKQIGFSTDFNRFYGDKELEPLKYLAGLYNSKIRIVHINEEEYLDDIQDYNLNVLKDNFKDYEHSFHWMPDYSKKAVEINDFIEELKIDILAMVNYKHSFIESIVNEPVIKKIGFHPVIPFLVIPD